MSDKLQIVTLKKGRILYIPKSFCSELGLKTGDRLIMKVTKRGLMIMKGSVVTDLDALFYRMDEDVRNLMKLMVEDK